MSSIFDDVVRINGKLAPYECYWDLPNEEVDKLSNGCGPGDWKIDLVPDSLLGCDFTESCNIHDVMYHFGKDNVDKQLADRVFLYNILYDVDCHCSNSGILNRIERVALRESAFSYYRAVSDLGNNSFWKDKSEK
jgi:hypothetical protein